jgi:hypothetical protein
MRGLALQRRYISYEIKKNKKYLLPLSISPLFTRRIHEGQIQLERLLNFIQQA